MLLTLPQETVNEVIAHLHGEERTLQSLSIAAKRFTEECRRHLFASIHIDCGTKLARWCDAIPPGEDGLSRYVRLLDVDTRSSGLLYIPSLLHDHLVHLRSFTQVEHLKICPLDLHKFSNQDLVDCFGHFSSTVRSIYIQLMGDYQPILHLLAMFPLLESTIIISPFLPWGMYGDVNLPNLVCRGDLILKACRVDNGKSIFPYLTRPTTRYRRLGLGLVRMANPGPLERFLETCAGSLESVQFICCFFGPPAYFLDALLSPLTELQDIKLSLRFFNDYFNVATILSSITSTKVASVTLFIWKCPFPNDLDDFSLRWVKLENALYRLTGLKQRTKSVGKVVLDVYFDDEELAIEMLRLSERGEFMPRFQQVGMLNVKMQAVDLNRAMSSIMLEAFK